MTPMWLVRSVDAGEMWVDAHIVVADSDQEAAELWAEKDDRESCDYTIVSGSPATVEVIRDENLDFDEDTGELKTVPASRRFIVSGESVPVYRAVEVKE